MTAVQITEYGSTDNLAINPTSAPGAPAQGQVLVEVAATSINPIDVVLAAGYLAEMVPLELPATIGGDFSGTVLQVGADVEHLSVGDKVIGQAGVLLGGSGSFASQILAPAALTTQAPADLDLVKAAALPLAGASAIQALHTLAVGPGSTVLILGGGGAVGSIAVQAAKQAGASVIASASPGDHDFVEKLGADAVHDYADTTWLQDLTGIDAILDASTGIDPVVYYPALKQGGRMVSLGTQHDADTAAAAGVEATTQMTAPTQDVLAELVRLVDAGVVTQRLAETFPLTSASEAFAADKQSTGKTLLVVNA